MKKKFIRKCSCILFSSLLLSSMLVGCGSKKNQQPPMEPPPDSSVESEATGTVTISQNTTNANAIDIMNNISVGWNLGNSFDSCVDKGNRNVDGSFAPDFYETAWGNPAVSFALIDSVKEAGFNTIRIPVTWYYNTFEDNRGDLHIQQEWINRIKEVVDYAISLNLYVILDSHHDAPILYADSADRELVKKNASDLWSEIAYAFNEYDNHLLFEGYNELNDRSDSWKISEENLSICNELNQLFVDTVRSTGGNNTKRVLVVGTYLNGTSEDILKGFSLPKDTTPQALVVSIHLYETTFDQDIEKSFTNLEAFSTKISAPVLITEFGTTTDFTPAILRGTHASNYVARAKGHKIKCIWWDDGSKYGLFNRETNSLVETSVVDGLMNPCTNTISYTQDLKISSIDQFMYQTIDQETGVMIDSTAGALTYIDSGLGLPVSAGKIYAISLSIKGSGDGMKISQVAFYDKDGHFITTMIQDAVTTVNLTAPDNASYMKIVLYNPWGVRTYVEYENMLSSKDLVLNIKEFALK